MSESDCNNDYGQLGNDSVQQGHAVLCLIPCAADGENHYAPRTSVKVQGGSVTHVIFLSTELLAVQFRLRPFTQG